MRMRSIPVGLLVLLLLTGCSSKQRPTVTVPALAAEKPPVRLGEEETIPSETAEPEHAEPALGAERVVVPPLRPASSREAEEPTEAEQAQDRIIVSPPSPRTPQPTAPAKTAEIESQLEADPIRTEPRPPTLKPMLSEGERRRLEGLIHGYIERARRNLTSIQEGRLEVNERTALQEARSILARAEQLRQSDPALSSSLAERAAILSQELLRKQR